MIKLKNGLGLAIVLAAHNLLPAQNLIKGSNTDRKFANTTIVYRDSTVSDAAILNQLNNSNLGVGDVVRITTAPPVAKPVARVAVKKAAPVLPLANAAPAIRNEPLASTDNVGSLLTGPALPPINSRKTQLETAPRIVPAMVENDRGENKKVLANTTAKSNKTVHVAKSARSNKAAKRTAARGQKRHKKQHYGCYQF
ncbi:MAG: hypothetical protein KGS48_06425 [Bacteroidetes bacterium]|nr:hypothetical protein [Bacteroidota bacterium]